MEIPRIRHFAGETQSARASPDGRMRNDTDLRSPAVTSLSTETDAGSSAAMGAGDTITGVSTGRNSLRLLFLTSPLRKLAVQSFGPLSPLTNSASFLSKSHR